MIKNLELRLRKLLTKISLSFSSPHSKHGFKIHVRIDPMKRAMRTKWWMLQSLSYPPQTLSRAHTEKRKTFFVLCVFPCEIDFPSAFHFHPSHFNNCQLENFLSLARSIPQCCCCSLATVDLFHVRNLWIFFALSLHKIFSFCNVRFSRCLYHFNPYAFYAL